MDTQDYDIHELLGAYPDYWELYRIGQASTFLINLTHRTISFEDRTLGLGDSDSDILHEATSHLYGAIDRLINRYPTLAQLKPNRVYLLTPFGEDDLCDPSVSLVYEAGSIQS